MSSDFLHPAEIPDEDFEEIMLDRPPGSVLELQFIYGELYMLGLAGDLDNISKDRLQYLTPNYGKIEDTVNEPDSLVFLNFDIDEESETIEYLGVSARSYGDEWREKLAFSKYPEGRAHDHSITDLTGGGKDPEGVAGDAPYPLTLWADEDPIEELIGTHEQGWMIDELHTLGEDDSVTDEISEDVEELLSSSNRRFISTRFITDSPDKSESVADEDWRYPADFDVFYDALIARQQDKWASKNEGESKADATDFITNERGEVFGSTSGPLKLYTDKKQSWLYRFDADDGAYTHPFSGKSAIRITNSEPLVDACGQSVMNGTLYHFPYFGGEQTVEKYRSLYAVLWNLAESSTRESMGVIQGAYQQAKEAASSETLNSLQFWSLFIHTNDSGARTRALGESPATSPIHYLEAKETAESVRQDIKNNPAISKPPTDDGPELLGTEPNHLDVVTSPRYFLRTCPNVDYDGVNPRLTTPAYGFYESLMRGETIQLSDLFKAYVDELDEKYSPDADYPLPEYTIYKQYAQLQVLIRLGQADYDVAGVAETTDSAKQIMNDTNTEDHQTSDQTTVDDEAQATDLSYPEAEERAFADFIDSHKLLSESPQRRAAFTLGAIITTIAEYQRSQDRSPITKQIGPKAITKRNFKRQTAEVLDLANTYGAEKGMDMLCKWFTKQLADDLLQTDPENWDLSNSDIQTHVALGFAYGATYREHDSAE